MSSIGILNAHFNLLKPKAMYSVPSATDFLPRSLKTKAPGCSVAHELNGDEHSTGLGLSASPRS